MAPSDEGTVAEEVEATNDLTTDVEASAKAKLKAQAASELKVLAATGLDYQTKIKSAKTAPKRKLYKKKLAKNSKRAAEVILFLERLQIMEAIDKNKNNQEFIDTRNTDDDTARGGVVEESGQP